MPGVISSVCQGTTGLKYELAGITFAVNGAMAQEMTEKKLGEYPRGYGTEQVKKTT